MIKLRLDIFITLVVKLYLVTAEARYYPAKSILRGGNPEVLDILLRGNGNPEISTVLSDNQRPILRISNPGLDATHRENLKPVDGGFPKAVIGIGNPAIAAMLRDNSKPFLLAAISEIPAKPRGKPKHNLLAGIPELSAIPHGNPKPNLHGGLRKLKRKLLREYTKPLLNNPAGLRVRKDSESDSNFFLKSGNNKYKIEDNDLKEAFNKMIDTVTKVNDERILSLNKFFELENYLPQVLRTTKQKNPLIAIIMNTPNYKSKYDNLNINPTEDPQYVKKQKQPSIPSILKEIIDGNHIHHNEDDDDDEVNISQGSDETRSTKHDYLRGWKSCNKSASKACRKACKKAFKSVCNDYTCSKSMKKHGKKECKRRCEEYFNNAGSSSESE